MGSLRIERLSFAYDAPLLKELSFELTPGFWGLIGKNGCGKSTLLSLMAGDLSPDEGRVLSPPGAELVLCPQLVFDRTAAIEELAVAEEKSAQRLKGRWDLKVGDLSRWSTLSPGERKRWQVAAAVHKRAHVLLLDEPTNHLDAEAREDLARRLAQESVIGVVVSHDRDFLQQLVRGILWLEDGAIEQFSGTYTEACATREHTRKELLTRRERLTKEHRRLRQRELEQKQRAQSADRMRNARRRMKDKNDSDARSILHANAAEWASKRLGKDGSALVSRRVRIDNELAELVVKQDAPSNLFTEYVPAKHSTVLSLQAAALKQGDAALLVDVSVTVKRQDKIWLRGKNGAGKTTLLNALLAGQRTTAKCLYLPQTLSLSQINEMRSALGELANQQRGRVLSFLAAQGTAPQDLLRSSRWSPGEAKKLALALGLAQGASVLLLDEPTNHLDLPSIAALQGLLCEFPGALILVSHDSLLGEKTTHSTWRIDDRRVQLA